MMSVRMAFSETMETIFHKNVVQCLQMSRWTLCNSLEQNIDLYRIVHFLVKQMCVWIEWNFSCVSEWSLFWYICCFVHCVPLGDGSSFFLVQLSDVFVRFVTLFLFWKSYRCSKQYVRPLLWQILCSCQNQSWQTRLQRELTEGCPAAPQHLASPGRLWKPATICPPHYCRLWRRGTGNKTFGNISICSILWETSVEDLSMEQIYPSKVVTCEYLHLLHLMSSGAGSSGTSFSAQGNTSSLQTASLSSSRCSRLNGTLVCTHTDGPTSGDTDNETKGDTRTRRWQIFASVHCQ